MNMAGIKIGARNISYSVKRFILCKVYRLELVVRFKFL